MKIFLVTRGSSGDVLPYLAIAAELLRRGHQVTLSLPREFEDQAEKLGIPYLVHKKDDIGGMLEDAGGSSNKINVIFQWIRRVIGIQFLQFVPVLNEHDLLVCTNTEFAAVSIAEYCRKPIVRTAYAPLIPGRKIPPPLMPFSKPNAILTVPRLWKILNKGTDMMVLKTLNRERAKRDLPPVKACPIHSVSNANNLLLHSPNLGETDPDWPYIWHISGYCFNDAFDYDHQALDEIMAFIKKDERPTLFFTLGSCDDTKKNRFCEQLYNICKADGYKLVVGSGWSKTGDHLENNDTLHILKTAIPHNLIFPHCTAVIHHGGSGTTHSVARSGRPQLIIPLIIDQHYWGTRVKRLGIGPGHVKISASEETLELLIRDLVTNSFYKRKAERLAGKIRSEEGIKNACDYIESVMAP